MTTWQKIENGLPPEQKSSDGVGTRKSKMVLIVYKQNKIIYYSAGYYDFILSMWISDDPTPQIINGQIRLWQYIDPLPMENPEDNELVTFTLNNGIEHDGIFILKENMFFVGFESKGDFAYSWQVNSWRPFQKPCDTKSKLTT